MASSDTTQAAADAQQAAWRRMSGADRMLLALEMSDDLMAVALAGVARRHADLSIDEQRRALVQLMHGIDLLPADRP